MRVQDKHWDKLMSVYKKDFPKVTFAYKSDKNLPFKATLVGWIFSFLGKFSKTLYEWYFLKSVTVIGDRVLFPPGHNWSASPYDYKTFSVLVHELRHLYQRRDDRLWEMKYLFWPAPIFYTKRADYEFEAYSDTMWCDYTFNLGITRNVIRRHAEKFTDYRYAWMSGASEAALIEVESKFEVVAEDIKTGRYQPVIRFDI